MQPSPDPDLNSIVAAWLDGGGSTVALVALHADVTAPLAVAEASGALVVAVPRTPLPDPFTCLRSAIVRAATVRSTTGHLTLDGGTEADLSAALRDRQVVLHHAERADPRLLALLNDTGTSVFAVVGDDGAAAASIARQLGVAAPIATDAVDGGDDGVGVGRIPSTVDLDDTLDRLGTIDESAMVELVASWLVSGEGSAPTHALAARAAVRLDAAASGQATRLAADRAPTTRRAVLLARVGDPSAPSVARAALAEAATAGPERRPNEHTVALHRLAVSDLGPDDPTRPAIVLAAFRTALAVGDHGFADELIDSVATTSDGALLVTELRRRLERPDLDTTLAGEPPPVVAALGALASWLPGLADVEPCSLDRFVEARRTIEAEVGDSPDLRIAELLLDTALSAHPTSSTEPDGAQRPDGSGREAALERLAAGVTGLHRSRPPAESADLVAFACDPAAGTGMSALAAAHLAVALGDAGRASEALALLDGRDPTSGRALPDLLARWSRAEVELAAGRPARAARLAADPLPAGANGEAAAPFLWLLQIVLDWAAVETRRETPQLVLPAAVGLAEAAPLERRAIADLVAGNLAPATEGFAAAADAWRGRHDRGALRCLWAAGEAARLAGDTERARHLLTTAEQEATHLGSLPLLSRIRQSLRRAGVAARVARSTGIGPLSGREVDVLRLVGDGRSSIDIGVQLGIAKSTVETQISSAMLKLNAATRLQAASMLRDLLVESGDAP